MCLFFSALLLANLLAAHAARAVGKPPEVLVPTLAALAAGRGVKALTEALAHSATPPAERHLSALVGVRAEHRGSLSPPLPARLFAMAP